MVGVFLAMLVLGLLAATFGPPLRRFLAVDKCLDAGGSFNHATEICEGLQESPGQTPPAKK